MYPPWVSGQAVPVPGAVPALVGAGLDPDQHVLLEVSATPQGPEPRSRREEERVTSRLADTRCLHTLSWRR